MSQLQSALAERSGPALDTLLSRRLRSDEEALTELLHYVYGPDGSKGFTGFGDYQIFYTHQQAFVDCILADTLRQTSRPVKLTLILKNDRWVLDRIEDRPDEDSLTVPPPEENTTPRGE
jgi:hypothetical protein